MAESCSRTMKSRILSLRALYIILQSRNPLFQSLPIHLILIENLSSEFAFRALFLYIVLDPPRVFFYLKWPPSINSPREGARTNRLRRPYPLSPAVLMLSRIDRPFILRHSSAACAPR